MKNVLLAVIVAAIVCLLSLRSYAWQNNKPLTQANLIDLLKGGVSPERVADLAAQKGVDFELSPAAETTLRQAGANAALIRTIRSLATKAARRKLTRQVFSSGPDAGSLRSNLRDGQRYVWIPAGSFMMGCSPGDSECFEDEKPQHQVTITKGFWMGQTPVTVAAWTRYRVATGTGALPTAGDDRKRYNGAGEGNIPAVLMTWDDAKRYCEWASMRLPTEAEWEYGARAGTKTALYADLDSIAWYFGNSGDVLHRVGQKQPNEWRLYDMLGNVFTWTADWYDKGYYSKSETDDPLGPPAGEFRVARGGSWNDFPRNVRLSYRYRKEPSSRDNGFGCRCAGDLP